MLGLVTERKFFNSWLMKEKKNQILHEDPICSVLRWGKTSRKQQKKYGLLLNSTNELFCFVSTWNVEKKSCIKLVLLKY